VRIAWTEPYTRVYQVQYWTGADAMESQTKGEWKTFKSGSITNSKGGTVTLHLDSVPVSTRYVRILMTQSSNTCDTHGSGDPRNCVGYAIREVSLGMYGNGEPFKDASSFA
jgi:hypothetical protein